jgi:hypothetical protein
MENYLAIKKKEIMSFAGKWMDLKIIMLSQISQSHKIKCHVFSLFCEIYILKKRDMKVEGGVFGTG